MRSGFSCSNGNLNAYRQDNASKVPGFAFGEDGYRFYTTAWARINVDSARLVC